MSSAASKIILVTGANQGLGFAIIKVAALRDPGAAFILASRKRLAGEEAAEKLHGLGVSATIDVVELDVTNDEQIAAAIRFVKTKFGRLDGRCFLPNPVRAQPGGTLALRLSYSSRQQRRHQRANTPPTLGDLLGDARAVQCDPQHEPDLGGRAHARIHASFASRRFRPEDHQHLLGPWQHDKRTNDAQYGARPRLRCQQGWHERAERAHAGRGKRPRGRDQD